MPEMPEKYYLSCESCGEVFDDVQIAASHPNSPSSLPECEDLSFELLPESVAF